MSKQDLEKLVGQGELSNTAKASLTQYVVDSYTALFTNGLQKAMTQCKTRADAIHFLVRLERIYQHVIEPALEGRTEDIVGRLPKEPIIDDRKYEIKYNGPYSTLGHALFDFRIQTDLPAHKIAHRLYMGTRTVWQLENNKQPMAPKAVMFYRRNEEKIKKRFLSLFAVPNEYEEEFMEIPLFASDVKSARDDYGTKRAHKRKLRQTSE